MNAHVTVDPSRCEGHAMCVLEAPGVFELDDDGFSTVTMASVEGADAAAAERAARACPAVAISVVRSADAG
ncbi:ferredoxin [Dactylosporangium sp. NPDC051485]|uniref:ferredoxin n=1 Tax=Dactylosporangium sp. NPDC051485 TaxID=3154846 RepID=UPI00342B503B